MIIEQSIIEFIEDKTHCQATDLSDHILGTIKSFDFMLLILELEHKFNIKLPFEQALAGNLKRIDQFIKWVEYHYES